MLYYQKQVPALVHNNQVKGGSIDIINYFEENFEGPSVFPDVRLVTSFCYISVSKFAAFKLHFSIACVLSPLTNYTGSCQESVR